MSLEKLVRETEYPPQKPDLLMTRTNKVAMIVEIVSPTPFALLRRTNHFQYRDTDKALQEFSGYEDPVQALSEECKRVLKAVSAANQSQVSSAKHSTSLREASWSRFEDVGFTSALQEDEEDDESALAKKQQPEGLKTSPSSGNGLDRPTTPSWADFLSSGFVDDNQSRSNLLLPPDKVLPPIETQNRQRSSQSHRPRLDSGRDLDPGELASITFVDLDDCFWWVWMSSLAPEETAERKAAFGRCAVVETKIRSGRWLVMEEIMAGAAPEPQEGAYIAEKKGLFSWARRGKTISRRKSTGKQALDRSDKAKDFSTSKTSIGPDTHAKIQAKAAQLRAASDQEKQDALSAQRRGRDGDAADKTNSVLTMQSNIVGEASSAMKWVNKYDKGTIKEAYMANTNAGRGMALSPVPTEDTNGHTETNGSTKQPEDIPELPKEEPTPEPKAETPAPSAARSLPARKPIAAPSTPKSEPEKKEVVQTTPAAGKAEEASVDPLEQSEATTQVTPAPPSKDEPPSEATMAAAVTPEPIPTKKQTKEKSGGFRKLFSRKNRSSKRSENAAADQNTMVRKGSHATEMSVQPTLTEDTASTLGAKTDDDDRAPPTPKASEAQQPRDTASSAQEAAEAKREFARFDQGPLADQPAFVPSDGGDVSPPSTIARRTPGRSGSSLKSSHEAPKEEHLSQSASPGVQDRWAQIRKNAAERAAQYQRPEDETTRSFKEKDRSAANDDDDTSGEESK